jgi:hypothetical protein
MTRSTTEDTGTSRDSKFSRRDWILLPTLSLLTILIIVVSTETLARRAFGVSKTRLESCLILDDASNGVRGIPNSVCSEKIPESQLVEYKFDCTGYRTGKECGPKPPGAYRIVLIGSSIAMGERVPIAKTFATLLPMELSRRVGREVELYNYAMAFGFPRNAALRFSDVLAAEPNLILWVVSSIDVKLAGFSHVDYAQNSSSSQQGRMTSLKNAIKDKIGGNPLAASVKALDYFVQKYKSPGEFLRSYLAIPNGGEGDWDTGPSALRSELSQEWKDRLRKFDSYAAEIARRAKTAGVPIVVVMVPTRAQAAMISMDEWPEGFDPFTMDKELGSIIRRRGETYVDILSDFRLTSNPEQHYYPIDGHPDADAHAMIARFLAKELTSGAVPELSAGMSEQIR